MFAAVSVGSAYTQLCLMISIVYDCYRGRHVVPCNLGEPFLTLVPDKNVRSDSFIQFVVERFLSLRIVKCPKNLLHRMEALHRKTEEFRLGFSGKTAFLVCADRITRVKVSERDPTASATSG